MGLPSPLNYPPIDLAALLHAVKIIHYVYPPALLIYFLGATLASFRFKQEQTRSGQYVRRNAILWGTLGVLVTFVCQLLQSQGSEANIFLVDSTVSGPACSFTITTRLVATPGCSGMYSTSLYIIMDAYPGCI